MRWKKFSVSLTKGDVLDVKIGAEGNKIKVFALNYRTKIGERFFEVYRVDNAHGFLHEQRYWISPEPISIPTMGKEIKDIFDFYLKFIRENFEGYKHYFLERKRK